VTSGEIENFSNFVLLGLCTYSQILSPNCMTEFVDQTVRLLAIHQSLEDPYLGLNLIQQLSDAILSLRLLTRVLEVCLARTPDLFKPTETFSEAGGGDFVVRGERPINYRNPVPKIMGRPQPRFVFEPLQGRQPLNRCGLGGPAI